MKVHDLKQKRAKLIADAEAILEKASSENRAVPAPEEKAKYDTLMEEIRETSEGIAMRESMAQLAAASGGEGADGSRLPHMDPRNTRDGRHRYSLMKALRQRMLHRLGETPQALDGIELEVHQELAKRSTRGPQGVLVPWDLGGERRQALFDAVGERRALDTTAGTGTIPTILDTTLIDILRNRMVVQAAGATVLADLQGLFAIPRQNATASMTWVAEGGTATGSNLTADQVAFTPKTAVAMTDFTRRFLEQTNQDAEILVRKDLMAVVARGVDLAALNGSGTSNQPKGILQNTSIGTVAIGTNGGAPTWDAIVGLESGVAVANADMGALSYVCDAATRGKLKRTAKIGSTFPIYIWDTAAGDTPLNGYPAFVTNQLPNNLTKGTGTNLHAAIFGNWNDLFIAFWSGLDIIVDPYTGSSAGTVRIVCLQDADINVRHPESFQKCVDIDVS